MKFCTHPLTILLAFLIPAQNTHSWFCFVLLCSPFTPAPYFYFYFASWWQRERSYFSFAVTSRPFSKTHRTLELDFWVPFHSLCVFLFLPPPFLSFLLHSPYFISSILLFLAFSCFSCFFCLSPSPSPNFLKVILQ